ncbi:MAG: ATP-binding protein, partial [Paracoccaceae bacterium]|nr:ATP-binding protein [Paracoccaceae bacterium]
MVTDNTALERLAHKERYAKVASGSGIVFGLIVAGAVVLFALYGNWIAALVGVSFAAIGIVLWRQRAIMGSLGVRLLWMSLVFGVALFYITMLPPDIDGHILLIPIMGLGLLLFSLKYERLIAYSVAAFVLVFFIVVDHISLQSQSPVLLGLPLISLGSHQVEKIVFEILPIIAFLSEVAVVSLLMNQTEERLIAEKSRAEASEKAKSMFMANMSHEIRTPMNGLLGMAQILETQNPTVDQRRSITVIKNSALALLRIIDDILDSSRIDAGKLSITPRRTEFLPIVEGVALTLMSMADDSDVRIRLFVDPLLPEWIRADAVRLRQIMFNLLSNGIKYSDSSMTKRHGFAYLIVEPVDDFTLRLVFWDNGVGMSDDVQKHLFEPYSRGNENEIQSQAGVGLGLMITRQLVSLMGGTIAVNSKQGEGTTITVTLPMIAESGPIKRPDLSGLTVVWMDYATDDVQEYTRRNYEAYNAKVIFEREVADLEAQGFDFDGDNIFVVRKEDAEASGRIRRQLAER